MSKGNQVDQTLYGLFLACRQHPDGDFPDLDIDLWTMWARVGNWLSVFEALKGLRKRCRRKYRQYLFDRLLDNYRLFLARENGKSAEDNLGLLLERGYLEAARDYVEVGDSKLKWHGYLEIYRRTKDPLDALKARKFLSSAVEVQWGNLLKCLLIQASTTNDSRDWDRVDRYAHRHGLTQKPGYWIERYLVTRARNDLAKAKALASALPLGSDQSISTWRMIAQETRSRVARRELDRSLQARLQELLQNFDGCLEAARDHLSWEYLGKAIEWINQEPCHHKRQKMIMEALSASLYLQRQSVV